MKSTLEISGERLAANLAAVQALAGENAEILAVLKADAYGHGTAVCAPVLRAAGARWLGVADVEEGIRLRGLLGAGTDAVAGGRSAAARGTAAAAGTNPRRRSTDASPTQDEESAAQARILVMCGMEPGDAEAMLLHELTPVVWTAEHLAALERAARSTGRRASVHIEVDSGMSRQGAQPGDALQAVLTRLADSPRISCEGVMTHLACAEEVGSGITERQLGRFAAALDQVLRVGLTPDLLHLGNSSALDEASTTGWMRDAAERLGARAMIRGGLALFGSCLPLSGKRNAAGAGPGALASRVHPVLRWTTAIIGVRELEVGEAVGYGATWTAPRRTRLALLPAGYADGFRRGASSGEGNGWVMIAGERAPVVGRVSMNLTTVDVTDHPAAREGAEVVLLGEGVTAADHAAWNGTIPYEILCGLRGHRVLA